MTKTDDILLELNRAVADYMRSVYPFQYKKKSFRLIDNYVAVPYIKCNACGSYPTFEVSVIESDNGEILRVGNDCIDYLTGRSVSEWFKNFRRKRECVIANRKYIEQVPLILNAQDNKELSFQIPPSDVEKLKIMLEQMHNGLNLSTGQEQIADYYLSIKATT